MPQSIFLSRNLKANKKKNRFTTNCYAFNTAKPINHCAPIRAFQIYYTLTSCLHNSSLVIESKKQKEEKLITHWTHALSSIVSSVFYRTALNQTSILSFFPSNIFTIQAHPHNYPRASTFFFFLKSYNPFRDSKQKSQVLTDFYKNQMLPVAPSQQQPAIPHLEDLILFCD